MRENIKIEIEENKEVEKFVCDELFKYNSENGNTPYFMERTEREKINTFCIYIKDDNDIIAGSMVHQFCDWLIVEKAVVNPRFRKNGYGHILFENIEKYATDNNLVGIRLHTWNFQAKPFYEKQGFECISEIRDYPRGNTSYELVKYL